MENLIIQWCREDQEYTTAEVAERTGISEPEYINFEKGLTSPSWKQAKELGKQLHLDKEIIYFSGQLIDNIRLLQQMAEDFAEQNERLLKELANTKQSQSAGSRSANMYADAPTDNNTNSKAWEVIETISRKLPLTDIAALLWQLMKQALLKESSSESRAVMIEFYDDTRALFEAISHLANERTVSNQQ